MSKSNDLFDYMDRNTPGITLPPENSLEENAKLLAEHHAKDIKIGYGFFFDFSATSEL